MSRVLFRKAACSGLVPHKRRKLGGKSRQLSLLYHHHLPIMLALHPAPLPLPTFKPAAEPVAALRQATAPDTSALLAHDVRWRLSMTSIDSVVTLRPFCLAVYFVGRCTGRILQASSLRVSSVSVSVPPPMLTMGPKQSHHPGIGLLSWRCKAVLLAARLARVVAGNKYASGISVPGGVHMSLTTRAPDLDFHDFQDMQTRLLFFLHALVARLRSSKVCPTTTLSIVLCTHSRN